MIASILSNNSISFLTLFDLFKRGQVWKDGVVQYFDKLNNVTYDNTAVFVTSLSALPFLDNKKVSGVITTREIGEEIRKKHNVALWIDDNPDELFYVLHEYLVTTNFYITPWENRIASSAVLSPHARIADHSVTIGEGCIVEANAVIKPFTIVGDDTILRSSCDIGSDGFEAHRVQGRLRIIKHGGVIVIGSNVEIQSLVTLSRGLFISRNTMIGDNVKIADLVHVAHGVVIGDDTMITAGCTIAGNSTIGSNVFVGPGATISNRISIGDNAYISIGSVVVRNVLPGHKVSGNFAYDHNKMLKQYSALCCK